MQPNLNMATYVGIDAHPGEHTACAMNRFAEEKASLTFENSKGGITKFLTWLKEVNSDSDNVVIGIEGGGNARHALVANLTDSYRHVYEVNPLYTKQRRSFGTRWDKSDVRDAELIAEVLTRHLSELPKLTREEYSAERLCLKKTVWFYEEVTGHGARIKTQLHGLERERNLSRIKEERELLTAIIRQRKQELKRIKKQQKQLEEKMDKFLGKGKNLIDIPAISTIQAAKIVTYSNGIERFNRVDSYIRYAGIAPVEKSSGRRKRHMKNKRGNRKLNSVFYLIAVGQIRIVPEAKKYFDRKVAEGKTKKHALRCLSKRIARVAYSMLKSGEKYQAK